MWDCGVFLTIFFVVFYFIVFFLAHCIWFVLNDCCIQIDMSNNGTFYLLWLQSLNVSFVVFLNLFCFVFFLDFCVFLRYFFFSYFEIILMFVSFTFRCFCTILRDVDKNIVFTLVHCVWVFVDVFVNVVENSIFMCFFFFLFLVICRSLFTFLRIAFWNASLIQNLTNVESEMDGDNIYLEKWCQIKILKNWAMLCMLCCYLYQLVNEFIVRFQSIVKIETNRISLTD